MKMQRVWNKLLYPPISMMIFLTMLSAAGLVFAFSQGRSEHPLAIVAYVVSAYTLTVVCVACVKVFPERYSKARQRIYDHPIGNRFMTDVEYKTRVSLYVSLGVNTLYSATHLFAGVWYNSVWFTTLAVYHIILATMRFLLLRYVNRNLIGEKRVSEFKLSRLCAGILITVNLALSGVVVLVIKQDGGFEYPGILIYVVALYTFYITIAAAANIIKYRKYDSPIITSAMAIRLTVALISMLSLEIAMFAEFGAGMSSKSQLIMIAATGAGICVIVVFMSVNIIVKANREIERLQMEA